MSKQRPVIFHVFNRGYFKDIKSLLGINPVTTVEILAHTLKIDTIEFKGNLHA